MRFLSNFLLVSLAALSPVALQASSLPSPSIELAVDGEINSPGYAYAFAGAGEREVRVRALTFCFRANFPGAINNCGGSASASADYTYLVDVTPSYEFYDVTGTTPDDVIPLIAAISSVKDAGMSA